MFAGKNLLVCWKKIVNWHFSACKTRKTQEFNSTSPKNSSRNRCKSQASAVKVTKLAGRLSPIFLRKHGGFDTDFSRANGTFTVKH
jgi:hypothetical protein